MPIVFQHDSSSHASCFASPFLAGMSPQKFLFPPVSLKLGLMTSDHRYIQQKTTKGKKGHIA